MAIQARIEHVAVWVHDLEPMRAFYTEALSGVSGRPLREPGHRLQVVLRVVW